MKVYGMNLSRKKIRLKWNEKRKTKTKPKKKSDISPDAKVVEVQNKNDEQDGPVVPREKPSENRDEIKSLKSDRSVEMKFESEELGDSQSIRSRLSEVSTSVSDEVDTQVNVKAVIQLASKLDDSSSTSSSTEAGSVFVLEEELTKLESTETESHNVQLVAPTPPVASPPNDSSSDSEVETSTFKLVRENESESSESEGSSEEFDMDDFDHSSDESEDQEEQVYYQIPTNIRLRRITELTEHSMSNRSSFRSTIAEEELQVTNDIPDASTSLVQSDDEFSDTEPTNDVVVDVLVGLLNDIIGEIPLLDEGHNDEGFVSAGDMLESRESLAEFDEDIFSPVQGLISTQSLVFNNFCDIMKSF